ncbi:hypothetical protein [Sphingopyxis sp. NJF-3]
MATKFPEGEPPHDFGGVRHQGFPRTAHMIDMGVIGMLNYGDGWRAEFEGYEGIMFDIPKPVADWLMKDSGR